LCAHNDVTFYDIMMPNSSAAVKVSCSGDDLKVVLADGRTVSAPLAWFPRLIAATPNQRVGWELIGGGIGILLQPWNFMRLPTPGSGL
jgi:hypothetical protein